MTTAPGNTRQRDADRSRSAILDAAERLFAEHGFDAVTMAQIGAEAGLSRGTPGYFFSSKEALYDAVVSRAATTLRRLVDTAGVRDALGARDRGTRLGDAVRVLLSLLVERRAIVALVERVRDHGDGGPPHAATIRALMPDTATNDGAEALSALALCWFPLSQPAAARALGIDPDGPDFVDRWAAHVCSLLDSSVEASAAPGVAPEPEAPQASPPAAEPRGGEQKPKKKKKKKKK